MECDENGGESTVPAATSGRGFKRKRRPGSKSSVQLALTLAVPSTTYIRSMYLNLVPDCTTNLPHSITNIQPTNYPFMNNMDEISYWIFTKRAPCLLNYDNITKTQVVKAHCSKTKPISIKSATEEVTSPSKKRKFKLIDEDSMTTEKQQNIYFDTSKNQNEKTAPSSCKSQTIVSEIGFNIRNTSVQNKAKRMRLQKSFQNLHKKNKIVSSTPKVQLRRSLRKAQQNNNNNHVNNSFQIFDTSIINGKKELEQDTPKKSAKIVNERIQNKEKLHVKEKNEVNGNFEDFSDVSGFTANYIRSTKLHSSKTPRRLRSRSRPIIKDTNSRVQSDKMIVCVNKSINTGLQESVALNCSTDSSQNLLNLVTLKNNLRSTRVNKSTSLLKFIDTNVKHDNGNISNIKSAKQEEKNKLNVSFQSSSGISRYPRRQKNNSCENPEQNCTSVNISNMNSPPKRYNMRRGKTNYVNQKKNPDEKIVSKTRSGRKVGIKLNMEQSADTTLASNLNDSSEHVSTSVTLNVLHPDESIKRNISTSRCLRRRRGKSEQLFKDTTSDGSERKDADGTQSAFVQTKPKYVKRVKKSIDKIGNSFSRVSLRDKSGFAACFSDSDSESEQLKQQKFFC